MNSIKYQLKNIHLGQSALVAVVCAAFFTVVLPLQTYFSNAEIFDYGAVQLLPEIIVAFIALALGIFACEIILEPLLGGLVHLEFLTLTICGYLEVGVLSIGLPKLNGELWLFCRPGIRLYLDIAVFVMLLGAVFICRKILTSVITWIALGLSVMMLAFLFDANSALPEEKIKTVFDDGFATPIEVVKSVSFSTNRNVIVICLDSTPADLASEIMQEDAEMRKQFVGFTEFKNNIGMHDCTTRGTPALVTGQYLEKNTTIAENDANFWGTNSCVTTYLNAGYDLYVRQAGGGGKCYTNRRTYVTKVPTVNVDKKASLRYTTGSPYVTLRDVLLFRLLPYRKKYGQIIKAIAAGDRQMGSGVKEIFREWQLYPHLMSAPVTGNRCFCLFHTEGVHVPIVRDGLGREIPAGKNTPKKIKANLHYLLRLVAELMDDFRDKGIYDSSMIVLTTDHGVLSSPKSALLWVKPIGEAAKFKTSEAPTTHSHIAVMLRASATADLKIRQIENMLSAEKRRLRINQRTPEKWWYFGRTFDTFDIFFDECGKEISRVNLGQFLIN